MRAFTGLIASRRSSGHRRGRSPATASKAWSNMRMISALSFETIAPRALSHRIGTVARVVAFGSEAT